MIYVSVEIFRFVCEHQPNIVEARLVDAFGQPHCFIEKIPAFTTAYLDSESQYPQPGAMACEILAQSRDEQGRDLREIHTYRPWSIESTSGKRNFVVLADQLFQE
jgi:hypothetical protein